MIGLRITDGTTTIDLNNSDPWEIMELDLGYGDPSEREIAGSIRLLCNGNGVSRPMSGSLAFFSQSFQALQKLLQQAIDYWRYDQGAEIADSRENIVYLECRTSASGDYYRTPITKARYNLPNETTWGISIGVDEVEYVIDFMRRNWWEGPEEQLALKTSIETTKTTTAVDIYNPKPYIYDWADGAGGPSLSFDENGGNYFINDAQSRLGRFTNKDLFVRNTGLNDGDYTQAAAPSDSQLQTVEAITDEAAAADVYLLGDGICNYIEITKGDVDGDLPSAVRMIWTDDGAKYGDGTSDDPLYELWMGHWFEKPSTDNGIILEAEDGNYDYVDDLLDTGDPPASGGYHIQFTEPFPASIVTYGTCTSGSTVSRVNLSASHTEADDYFNGYAIYIYDGTNKGLWRTITDYNRGSPNYVDVTPDYPTPCTTSSKYRIYPPGTTSEAEKVLYPISWTLTTSTYNARYFKAILKLYDDSGSPDDYNYQLRMLRDVGGTVIWEGPIVRYGGFDTDLQARDLGTFRIPPTRKGSTAFAPVTLELVLTPYDNTVTGVDGINIDYLYLLPVDGFRYIKFISGLPYGYTIVDSGYDDYAYYTDMGASIYGDMITRGNPIMLQPEIAQRIYFFAGEDIYRRGSVQLYYRPRRLNI